MEERLRSLRIEKYGAGGEKLSKAQMQLFELEPVVSGMIGQAESEHASVHRSTKKGVKHPGRQELPANLPRIERVLPCTPDQRMCKRCGGETVVIGYEESSQLDVEPAKYFVLVTKREKRACRSCEDLGVVSARLPPRIIEKCLASDRISGNDGANLLTRAHRDRVARSVPALLRRRSASGQQRFPPLPRGTAPPLGLGRERQKTRMSLS